MKSLIELMDAIIALDSLDWKTHERAVELLFVFGGFRCTP
jgi:hypothetical protein